MATPPREFIGMARAFYRRVYAADGLLNPAADQINALVKPRLKHKPTLRPEMILEAERLWKANVPDEFRLILAFQHPPKGKGLHIREFRLSCMNSKDSTWDNDDDEKNIAITHVDLKVDAKKARFTFELEPIAQVSLHALARRFERGRDRSHEAVFDDLAALCKPGFYQWSDRVAVPSGIWLGERRDFDLQDQDDKTVKKADCFTVRTFYDNDMLLDGAKLTV